MSTLPAGQFITTIGGKQCTAIPQTRTAAALASQSSASAASIAAQAAQASQASIASVSAVAQASSLSSVSAASVASALAASQAAKTTSVAVETTSSTSIAQVESTTSTTQEAISTTAPPEVASTSIAVPLSTSTSEPISSTTLISAAHVTTTASKETTPTTFSSSVVPVAQSEVLTTSTPTVFTSTLANQNGRSSATTSSATGTEVVATAAAQETTAGGGISSTQSMVGPMVGGIVGSIALVGIVGLIFWFFRRRRRNRRDSLLTPLGTRDEKNFYDIDQRSMASSNESRGWTPQVSNGGFGGRFAGFKAGVTGLGASMKSKVLPRSATPNVNLNRGNSQFLDGPIPQHSRSNSTISQSPNLTVKDRFNDWWDRFTDNLSFNKRLRNHNDHDPFAAARRMKEQQDRSNAGTPDFSQLLGIDDRDLQIQADRRRADLGNSVPNLGSLGIDFESHNPFADSASSMAQKPATNPFADPIVQPGPTIPRTQTYVADIRRSRGQSIDMATTSNNASAYAANTAAYRPPSTAVGSRYPSTIAPSRDSYRDTLFSTFSSNTRKGKGRSDPFDLDSPVWRNKDAPPMPSNNRLLSQISDVRESALPGPLQQQPRVVSGMQARTMSSATYASKYSSGVSSLGGWGDPGPDVGSTPSSLRNQYGGLTEALQRQEDQQKERGGSPVSDVSSRYGVGKAR